MRSKEKAFAHFDLSPGTLNKEAQDAVTGRRISNIGRELMEAAPDPGPTIDQAAECSTETVINGNASSNREWFEWFRPSLCDRSRRLRFGRMYESRPARAHVFFNLQQKLQHKQGG